MRAVLSYISDDELARRKQLGLDRRDEMWEGVLHMTPAPNVEHQRILDELIRFLGGRIKTTGRGTVLSGINVFRSDDNYRIPDLTFVTAGRESFLAEDGVRGEGPDGVIEIRSPHDESYEKLPFYATIGVREAIVIDRDTKRPEVFRLVGSQYVALQPDREGWLLAETLQVRFRSHGAPPKLQVEDAIDSSVREEI
jgi:Uma2 family endonuclease